MTRTQMYAIWNLAMEIQIRAIFFARSYGSEEHFKEGTALIKAKENLYQYLKENLDDTESL